MRRIELRSTAPQPLPTVHRVSSGSAQAGMRTPGCQTLAARVGELVVAQHGSMMGGAGGGDWSARFRVARDRCQVKLVSSAGLEPGGCQSMQTQAPRSAAYSRRRACQPRSGRSVLR